MPAHAAITTFNNRSSLEGVLGPHEAITFEEFPDGPIASCTPVHPFIPDPCVLTTEGITFTSTVGEPGSGINQRPILVLESSFVVAPSKLLNPAADDTSAESFFLTFSHPLQGIGLDILGGTSFPPTVIFVKVTEANGSVTEIPIGNALSLTFFGVTSDIGITKLSLFDPISDGSSGLINISNIVVPTPTVPLTVSIDILKSINLKSHGVFPVAILSSSSFDAPTQINPNTLTIGGATVKTTGKKDKAHCQTDDVDGDGLLDLVCEFSTDQFSIQPGASTAVLEGETFDGTPISGAGSVNIH